MNCTIEGCRRKHYGRGWCSMHYHRWRNHGNPLKTIKTPSGKPLAFLHSIMDTQTDACIVWPYGQDGKGYGKIRYKKKLRNAHAVCLEIYLNQKQPKDMKAAHSCGNPCCVNPLHLRFATPSENAMDRLMHGTANRGEAHGLSKLKEKEVREIRIRLQSGDIQREIAKDYGVTQGTITLIKCRRNWAWLK